MPNWPVVKLRRRKDRPDEVSLRLAEAPLRDWLEDETYLPESSLLGEEAQRAIAKRLSRNGVDPEDAPSIAAEAIEAAIRAAKESR